VLLQIADITTALVSDDPDLSGGPSGAASAFLVKDARPDATVRVAWGKLGERCDGQSVFDAGGLWQLYCQDHQFLFRFFSPSLGPVPYKTASFNSSFTAGTVLLHRPYFDGRGAQYPLEYPLDELLLINLLAQGRGLEMHACGLIDRSGSGYLFAGQSGAGKTTVARLWRDQPGVTILSDDRIVLRAIGDRLWMYGTPWHGDEPLASPARVPLSRVFLLQQASRPALVPINKVEAAARLFASSFPPFHSRDGVRFSLALLDRLVHAIPCLELRFTPDSAVVDLPRREVAVLRA
jgi:hypothetical protein